MMMIVIFVVVIFVVVFVVIVVLVVVMLVLVFAMELSLALIMPVNPVMILPMPGYPHPIVTIIPIVRTIVIRPIAQLDRETDRHGAWPGQQANRQESHNKSREFRFHSLISCSY
jgi:hypothetical protein